MALIGDFVAELAAITEVSTAVGASIHPVVDTGQALPSIVFNTRGGAREAYVKDSFGLRETFIQLDIYSETYAQLDSLRNAVISHFNGFTGQFNSNTQISSCQFVTARELRDGQNDRVYRAVIEFNILSD